MIYQVINNGEFGILKDLNERFKKYANGVDSNLLYSSNLNNWHNGQIEIVPPCKEKCSECGGNYWSDYKKSCPEAEYDKSIGEWNERGIWDSEYHLWLEIPLYIKVTPLKSLYIYNNYIFDKYPWCRKNGWRPSPPDVPTLEIKQEGNSYSFIVNTTDLNDDKIYYYLNISGFPLEKSGLKNSGELYTWTKFDLKPGTYNISVMAVDHYDGGELENSDGESPWLSKEFIVEV
jgi:hypothetical protein